MKHRKQSVGFLFLTVLLLFCFTACTPQVAVSEPVSQPPSSEETASKATLKTSFGLDFEVPGIRLRVMEGVTHFVREFDYPGGELIANLILRSAPGTPEELGVLFLCEGIPMEYTVLETGEKGYYHVFHVEEGEKIVKISCKPDFDQGLGRLDMVVCPLASLKGYPGPAGTMQGHAILPEGYQAESLYQDRIKAAQSIPKPEKLIGNTGRTGFFLSSAGTAGPFTPDGLDFRIAGTENTWIYTCVPEPGKYRIFFTCDGELLEIEEGKIILEATLAENEMLELKLPLKSMLSKGEHSLTMFAARVDGQGLISPHNSGAKLSSFRSKLINE